MLNTLATILEKRGSEYVDKFLSEKVTITEKLDTYRVLFEKVNGELRFSKKDNSELGLIERVLTNIWEDAIVELSIILNLNLIPEGLSFGIAYTPVNKPIRLMYERLPKYVLTDVTKRDPDTKKVLESYDYDEVTSWATTLGLARPPIVFEGELAESQKQQLIEYAQGNYIDGDKLFRIFPEGSYSKAEVIEGIIIKGENQICQVESYEFKILNETYQRVENSREFYDLMLLRINSFMDDYRFPVLEGDNSDDLYLELICDIFNNFCKSGLIAEDLDPNLLSPPSFGYGGNLNVLLLKNGWTIDILKEGTDIHDAVFKIMLSSFRKYKKAYGLLRESDVAKFNTYVYFINEATKGAPLPKIGKVEMITEQGSNNIVVKATEEKIRTDVDTMRVISSVQKAFNPVAPSVRKGKQKCVVYVIDPQPLTEDIKVNVESLAKLWKAPVLLAFVEGERKVEGKDFHLSDQLKRSQLESFADDHQKLVPAFFSLSSWDLIELFEYCRPNYEPIAVITDAEKKSEFVLQLYFEEEVMGERIGVEQNFNIGEMENSQLLLGFRAIEDGNFHAFKQVTPQSVAGLFDSMKSEYKEWNGSVPSQFQENKFA